MSMSDAQVQAFYAASGVHVTSLTFCIQLLIGGIAILTSLMILAGLMRLLETNQVWDKVVFLMCLMGLSFVLMLIFIYLA